MPDKQSKQLDICVVSTWPPHKDGVAFYSWKLYNNVAKQTNVTVIANRTSDSEQNNAQPSIRVIKCWRRSSLFSFLQIFRANARNKSDVIHVQHGWLLYGNLLVSSFFPFLLLILRLFRRPVVITMHSIIRTEAISKNFSGNYVLEIFSRPIVLWITRLIGTLGCRIIVHNVLMKQVLVKEYSLPPSKIVVIHHGVDKATISEKIEPIPNSILFFGHLRPMKGIENLLQAFQLLLSKKYDAKLFIVGSSHAHDKPDYLRKLQTEIDRIGRGRVTLETSVSENRLSQLITASEIIVLPYLDDGFIEASGALARMMDYGKAVICSNIPKFRGELLDESVCTFVPPDDYFDLEQSLGLLLSDLRLRMDKARQLKKLAKTRYWDLVAKEHAECYESLQQARKVCI